MQKTINILQNKAYFIFLLPLFLVMHLEKTYPGLIPYGLIWKWIALLFIIALLVYALCRILVKDKKKAAVCTLLVLILYFFFADIKDSLHDLYPSAIFSRYLLLFPALLILLGFSLRQVLKSRNSFRNFYLYTNLLLIISLLVDIGGILINRTRESKGHNVPTALGLKECRDCRRPDIYYLLFDSYSSSSLLQSEFHFNNSELDSFLVHRGFFISTRSRSNYNFTSYSMASIFNMRYLAVPDSTRLLSLRGLLPGVEKIREGRIFPIMEKFGYKIYNHSIFNIRNHPSTTSAFDIWDIASLYNRHQLPWKMMKDIGWHFVFLSKLGIGERAAQEYIDQRDKNFESTLEQLHNTTLIRDSMPKFVYAHSLLPHAPFSYDSNGHRLPFREYDPQEDRKAYLRQLVYTNRMIMKTIDDILEANGRDCIIILQGDHAFRFFDPSLRDEEFKNLNAFYFYNRDYHLLKDSMSSVNTFPLLLNTHFRQELPVLKDSIFFLPYRLSF